MKFDIKMYLSVMILPLLLVSCSYSTDNADQYREICFEKEVLPLIQTNCAMSGCHGAGSKEEELLLNDYTAILNVVTPGKPEDSELYKAITETWDEPMPPSPREALSIEQRSLIYLWILQGAKNTTCK